MSRSRKGRSSYGGGGRRSSAGRGGGMGQGRGGNRIGRFFFAIFVLAAVVAVYQIPYDPGVSGITNIAKSKAEHAGEWAKGIAPSIEKFAGDLIKGGRPEPTEIGIPDGESYPESTGSGESTVGSYENSGDTKPGEGYESNKKEG